MPKAAMIRARIEPELKESIKLQVSNSNLSFYDALYIL